MGTRALGALVAMAVLGAAGFTPARAADLGGDCCADLEERIAELEATTVRKGNRKVSLSIAGWVSEQVLFWDDGVESNVYVQSLGTAFASNFNLTGKAQISPGVTAGFVLHLEWDSNNVYTTTQDNPNGPPGDPVLYANWFIKSDDFGKVSVGKISPADDSAVVAIDGSGTLAAAYWVAYDVFSFRVRGNFAPGDSLIWGNAISCRGYGGGPGDCDGLPRNVVRYDSPVFAGFMVSASWGEDDIWAVAGKYAAEFSGFKLAAVATYSETTDQAIGGPAVGGALEYLQASAFLHHVPSGLWGQVAWGHLDQSVNPDDFPETDAYYVKSGVRLKVNSLGATIPYGEYLYGTDGALIVNDNGTAGNAADDVTRVVEDSESTFWGFGVVQEIDAAAMSVWLRYRSHEVDVPGVDTKDLDTVVFGGFINF